MSNILKSPANKKILIAQVGDKVFLEKTLEFLTNLYPNVSIIIFPNPSQRSEVNGWLSDPVDVVYETQVEISVINHHNHLPGEAVDMTVFMYHPHNRYRLALLKHYFVLNSLQAERRLITNDGYWSRFSLTKLMNRLFFLGISKILISPLLNFLALVSHKGFSLLEKLLAFDEYREIRNWAEMDWGDTRDECPGMIMDAAGIILNAYEQGRTDLLQSRSCHQCGQDKPEFLFKSEDGFDYVRCQNCGYTYIKNIVSQSGWEYIEAQYPDWQKDAEMTYLKYARSSEGLQEDDKRFGQYLDLLSSYAHKTGKVLDIGCASGNFLRLVRARGWKPIGIERSPLYVTAAKRDYDLSIINAKFEDACQMVLTEYGHVDAVTMWETLEHVDNPNQVLEMAAELLSEGGLIGISVPNMESLYVKLLKERFAPCAGIGHINMFTAQTLTAMLEKKGFRMLHIHTLEPGWDELLALLNLDFRRARSLSRYVANNDAKTNDMTLQEPYVNQVSRLVVQTYSRFLTKITEPINPGPILVCIARKQKQT